MIRPSLQRVLRIGLGIFGVVLLAGVFTVWWGWRAWTGPGPEAATGSAESVLLDIPAGMTLSAAADTLVSRGLLEDSRILIAVARLTGQGSSLRTGMYRLKQGASPRQLLADLTSGLSVQIKVTLPEGLDAEEISAILGPALGFPPERFLTMADSLVAELVLKSQLEDSPAWAEEYGQVLDRPLNTPRKLHWCEGYLAPDTYFFGAGTTAEVAADHLISTQMQRLEDIFTGQRLANEQIDSPHQLLTLASIVEAEARHDHERGKVAAVYTNRLAQGWRLEADPTVAFILSKKGKRLFYRDLKVDSPYNTYRNKGLPPGPIGAPGRLALEAAASPEGDFPAMYFVSDGQGGHVFSRTSKEHQEAVRHFRKLKAEERRKGRD